MFMREACSAGLVRGSASVIFLMGLGLLGSASAQGENESETSPASAPVSGAAGGGVQGRGQVVGAGSTAPSEPLKVQLISTEKSVDAEPLKLPQMIKYGFSFGVAAAFVTPADLGKPGAEQIQTAVSAMPYVAWIPAYHALGSVSREWCATRAARGRRTAQIVADDTARRQAQRDWDEAWEKLGEDYSSNTSLLSTKIGEFENLGKKKLDKGEKAHLLKRTRAYLEDSNSRPKNLDSLCSQDQEICKTEKDFVVYLLSGWRPGARGRCYTGSRWISPLWNTMLGIYFGMPFPYATNFRRDEGDSVQRSVKSRGSLGLVFTPFPYFSLLAGVTNVVASRPLPKDDVTGTTPTTLDRAWQFTLGVGGSVDIAGAFVEALKK